LFIPDPDPDFLTIHDPGSGSAVCQSDMKSWFSKGTVIFTRDFRRFFKLIFILQVQEGGEAGWRWLLSYYRRLASRRRAAERADETAAQRKDHTASMSRVRRILANW
jgi:hypothetical protein